MILQYYIAVGGNNSAVILVFSDKACKVCIMDFFCIYRVDWYNISSMDCCKMKAWIAVTFLVWIGVKIMKVWISVTNKFKYGLV